MITALAGGVGAAKLLRGMIEVIPQEELTVIVNTGDDIELYGLHVSPDVDIIMYTLAGIVDEEKGWGIKGDTFNCLKMIKTYGFETWFKLGDMDLSTHVLRTKLLREGLPLSKVTSILSKALGLRVRIIPMSNEPVTTRIVTRRGVMHFEEYLVKHGAVDEVLDVFFEGIDLAKPAPGVIEAILNSEAVVICPSNPIVSIGPIISIKGVRSALKKTSAKIIGISPIVSGTPIKGPADRLMRGLGLEVSAFGVAKLYSDFIDAFIIDQRDSELKEKIEDLGMKVVVADTIMSNLEKKVNLARIVLDLASK